MKLSGKRPGSNSPAAEECPHVQGKQRLCGFATRVTETHVTELLPTASQDVHVKEAEWEAEQDFNPGIPLRDAGIQARAYSTVLQHPRLINCISTTFSYYYIYFYILRMYSNHLQIYAGIDSFYFY